MRITDRKSLLRLLDSVNTRNRRHYQKFGKWIDPSVKVFWVEARGSAVDSVLPSSVATAIDRELYQWSPAPGVFYWVDASDPRIWQVFTLEPSAKARGAIRNQLLVKRGIDKLWFPESFLERIVKRGRYDERGVGIKYKDLLSAERFPADFSAKLWVGRSSSPEEEAVIEFARERYGISSVRFGRNASSDGIGLSGQLYEMFHDGHLTVTTCDDTEQMFDLLSEIRSSYEGEITSLERAHQKHPTIIELGFSRKVDPSRLDRFVRPGKGRLRLWLHLYAREPGLVRYSGVDLHSGDYICLDVGDDFAYVSAERNACMNVAPRLGTLASRYLSSKATLSHDGVTLFGAT